MGRVANLGLGSRLVDVISNTSKVCTSERRIVEQSIARSFDQKLSGVKFPISHQLMEASGTQPTPDIPVIGIWLDVMAVLRRLTRPYQLRYGLAPNVTYSDHGRDLLARLTKENVLCTTKGLTYNRQNLFSLVTNAELRSGSVRMCNLLDQRQTELPIMTEEELMGITLGPHAVDSAHGYLTDYHEEDVIVLQQGNYQNPTNYHQQASQVKRFYLVWYEMVHYKTISIFFKHFFFIPSLDAKNCNSILLNALGEYSDKYIQAQVIQVIPFLQGHSQKPMFLSYVFKCFYAYKNSLTPACSN